MDQETKGDLISQYKSMYQRAILFHQPFHSNHFDSPYKNHKVGGPNDYKFLYSNWDILEYH